VDGTIGPVRTDDPYELLGIPRDAGAERIRRAYELEVQRAHRAGATAHAVALSRAYDTLSDPGRRALFDRHGLAPVRERSPGAASAPTPWRIVKQQPLPPLRIKRRTWRAPATAVFCLGIAAGLALAVYLQSQSRPAQADTVVPTTEHQVLCGTTPAGEGYIYSEAAEHMPACTNGAIPRVLR
jgi:curved DNA-binding protein CbpA